MARFSHLSFNIPPYPTPLNSKSGIYLGISQWPLALEVMIVFLFKIAFMKNARETGQETSFPNLSGCIY